MSSELDQQEDKAALPNFITKLADGVFADLAKLDSPNRFQTSVERIFASGYYFHELDYERFLDLAYGYTPEKLALVVSAMKERGINPVIRFASDIVKFPSNRRELYKLPKIVEGKAEYIFEPVMLEYEIEEPLSGIGGDGEPGVAGFEKRTISERTSLEFDEFVAEMWMKDIRYGIDAPAVRATILSGKTERVLVAKPLDPTPGKDAGLEEQMKGLYRDDSPKKLSNGKVDFRQFNNHFPQVKKGARILKKIPRVLGLVGWDVAGQVIEPPIPTDFDFTALAGEGALLDCGREGDFIVANADGFLTIDTATSRISVNAKIINRSGVSVRTTGDISLGCEEYEEFGEVQEKRIIEGKCITVHADVFGSIISSGGKIHLKQNLMGGTATNNDGDVVIDGLVSGAVVYARNGTVSIKRAENSIIVGKHVNIESAVKCDVCGEDVAVENSAGCAIAGKFVRLVTAGPRQERETVVSMLVPDLSGYDQEISVIGKKIEEVGAALVCKRREAEAEASATQGEARNYLVLEEKLRKKEITLTPEQMQSWKNLAARVAPGLKILNQLNGEVQLLQTEKEMYEGKVDALMQYKQDASTGISCAIRESHGDTLVRVMKTQPGAVTLADLEPKQLKAQLLAHALPADRLFSGEGGPFEWRHRAPGTNKL